MLLRDALCSVASQLERDLDNAIRENDYITDETADRLKAVVSELDHCGVSTSFLNSKIEKLAWFVGGDPAKIRNLQSKLNDLGVGHSLKVDGVYGAKTKAAIDRLIDKTPDFLKDPNKLRAFAVAMEAVAAVGVAYVSKRELDYAIKKGWQLLWNTIWDLGAECYLRPKGYHVAALLLQNSLQSSPSDLHFSQSHWVTQKIMQSNGFQKAFVCRNTIFIYATFSICPCVRLKHISINNTKKRNAEFFYDCIRILNTFLASLTTLNLSQRNM